MPLWTFDEIDRFGTVLPCAGYLITGATAALALGAAALDRGLATGRSSLWRWCAAVQAVAGTAADVFGRGSSV